MTWSKFITWLLICYGAYYVIVFVYDLVKGVSVKPPATDDDSLDFSSLYSDTELPEIGTEVTSPPSVPTPTSPVFEEKFEIQLLEKKKDHPIEDIYKNITGIIPPVRSQGLTLAQIIAQAKMGALEMSSEINY
jgi:hypothetical protein